MNLIQLIIIVAFFANPVKMWIKSIDRHLNQHGYWDRFDQVTTQLIRRRLNQLKHRQ